MHCPSPLAHPFHNLLLFAAQRPTASLLHRTTPAASYLLHISPLTTICLQKDAAQTAARLSDCFVTSLPEEIHLTTALPAALLENGPDHFIQDDIAQPRGTLGRQVLFFFILSTLRFACLAWETSTVDVICSVLTVVVAFYCFCAPLFFYCSIGSTCPCQDGSANRLLPEDACHCPARFGYTAHGSLLSSGFNMSLTRSHSLRRSV